MKVRITKRPLEREIDGVSLDRMVPGSVREVSGTIGAWLITEGYAAPEMRRGARDQWQDFTRIRAPRSTAAVRRRRRSTDG